jgi:hypothetical protein
MAEKEQSQESLLVRKEREWQESKEPRPQEERRSTEQVTNRRAGNRACITHCSHCGRVL